MEFRLGVEPPFAVVSNAPYYAKTLANRPKSPSPSLSPARFNMNFRYIISAWAIGVGLILASVLAAAEPRIVIGPTEAEEEPEIVETISGLSYDQLRRLRALRRWLDERQMIREQRGLQSPQNPSLRGPFADRPLLSPLGQRYAERLPLSQPGGPGMLKLPPLPHFDAKPSETRDPTTTTAGADGLSTPETPYASAATPVGRRITHITPPPPGAEDDPQIEYELHPDP